LTSLQYSYTQTGCWSWSIRRRAWRLPGRAALANAARTRGCGSVWIGAWWCAERWGACLPAI